MRIYVMKPSKLKMYMAALLLLDPASAWSVNYKNSTITKMAFSKITSPAKLQLDFVDENNVPHACTGFVNDTNIDVIAATLIAPISQPTGSVASEVNIRCSDSGFFTLDSVTYKD